ncbi:Threonylcarbamoyl-AMP synthase [Rubripirellula amarantea]|uniref:Threonylcarbamoyl-AMP synthase n=1 Tax=Rubripirellula amarantea TaxID=2527999 RepID=A0A5C5WPH1_9BACT|nr:L-threonylcarbamoyladenylate synthase [Rubripirellula amarantea]TWT52754.1 Threonylcarbamoyl-AMP synthase [Rubripirellula amarantea]
MRRNKITTPTFEAIQRAAVLLADGQLVAIPTETVYGLAANALDELAVKRIFAAKGRPATNPLIVHLADVTQLAWVTDPNLDPIVTQRINKLSQFWPGPLTLVLPRNAAVPDIVTAGLDTVAVRIPSHEVARQLIHACGFPLAAPSANRSNYVSPTLAIHVIEGLGDEVEMVLDGGPCGHGLESTIVKLDGQNVTMLRPGVITRDQIANCLGTDVLVHSHDHGNTSLLAPGMMREHYSPTTPIRFVDEIALADLPPRCGRIAFAPLATDSSDREQLLHPFIRMEVLSPTGDLSEVARELFGAIRRLDHENLDLLLVDRCEPTGVGEAIMDRLTRATAKSSRS